MLQRDLGKGILEGSGSLLHTGLPPSLLNGAETFPTALHTGSLSGPGGSLRALGTRTGSTPVPATQGSHPSKT